MTSPSKEREDLRRDSDRKEIPPVDRQKGKYVVAARVEVAVVVAIELDRRRQLVSEVLDVALHRFGGDVESLREPRRVRIPPVLDLMVDRLETPPERPILEGALAAHGADCGRKCRTGPGGLCPSRSWESARRPATSIGSSR
jgi:hypothetical protein